MSKKFGVGASVGTKLGMLEAGTVEAGIVAVVNPETVDHNDDVGTFPVPALTDSKNLSCFTWNCGETVAVCRFRML